LKLIIFSGWTIFYNWLIVLPAEISAATILVGYWDQSTNPAIYITAAILIITSINLLGAKSFGECEFWLTSLKVLCILCLLILSLMLMAGVGDQGVIGFRYWKAPWTLFNQYPLDRKKGTFVPGALGDYLKGKPMMARLVLKRLSDSPPYLSSFRSLSWLLECPTSSFIFLSRFRNYWSHCRRDKGPKKSSTHLYSKRLDSSFRILRNGYHGNQRRMS
jgi:hypothetical protein